MTWTLGTRALQAFTAVAAIGFAAVGVTAFDNSRYDNVAVYWGQNSYGATHSDVANYQKTLSYYCQDNAIDVIPISFITKFVSTGNAPELDLANICNKNDNATFPGTSLANCQSLASDIQTCQSKGKLLTLSLGGGGATGIGFQSDSAAEAFADTIWNDFLGGSSSTRPFGSAVLDGVDLDIEGGGSSGYAAFVTRLRSHFNGASKKYYITAAPQCVYPDANLGAVLNAVGFDAVYVQFYNNPCGLQAYNNSNGFNYGIWDIWAKSSPNPNVKIYIGAPASSTAAGGGYQDPATLATILTNTRKRYPSFGGVMMWDASQAYVNNRYDLAAKNALVAAGGTGFTYPACSAPAFSSGSTYTANSQVSYNGYIWTAKWWSQNTPSADPNGDWMPISACAGGSVTTTAGGGNPTGTSCGGVAAWNAATVYTGGEEVSYNGHLWTAKWWTQNETPGSSSGVWTDNGACASSKKAAKSPDSSDSSRL